MCHDKLHFGNRERVVLLYHGSARCALNRDTFCLGSCIEVSCCFCVPDDSRTQGCTVGGRRICLADGIGTCGFWNEGESMIVFVMGDGASPPPLPGGGAKDGESIIVGS